MLVFVQFLCRVLTHAVESLGPPPTTSSAHASHKLPPHSQRYTTWCSRILAVSRNLAVDTDDVNIHLCCQLYSSGWDKIAKEVTLENSNQTRSAIVFVNYWPWRMLFVRFYERWTMGRAWVRSCCRWLGSACTFLRSKVKQQTRSRNSPSVPQVSPRGSNLWWVISTLFSILVCNCYLYCFFTGPQEISVCRRSTQGHCTACGLRCKFTTRGTFRV